MKEKDNSKFWGLTHWKNGVLFPEMGRLWLQRKGSRSSILDKLSIWGPLDNQWKGQVSSGQHESGIQGKSRMAMCLWES